MGELVRATVVVAQVLFPLPEFYVHVVCYRFLRFFSHLSICHLILHIFGVDSPDSKGISTLSHAFSVPHNNAKISDAQIPNLCIVPCVNLDL